MDHTNGGKKKKPLQAITKFFQKSNNKKVKNDQQQSQRRSQSKEQLSGNPILTFYCNFGWWLITISQVWSPGLGGDSYPRGCEFESEHRIQPRWLILHTYFLYNCIGVWKDRKNKKRLGIASLQWLNTIYLVSTGIVVRTYLPMCFCVVLQG